MGIEKFKYLLDNSESWKEGKYELSSGDSSNHYFDGKKFIFYPECAYYVSIDFINYINNTVGICNIVGISKGGIPIISAIATNLVYSIRNDNYKIAYISLDFKQHGIRGHYQGSKLDRDLSVVLIEDTIYSGESIIDAYNILTNNGYKVTNFICIADRTNGSLTGWLESAKIELYSIYKEVNGELVVT